MPDEYNSCLDLSFFLKSVFLFATLFLLRLDNCFGYRNRDELCCTHIYLYFGGQKLQLLRILLRGRRKGCCIITRSQATVQLPASLKAPRKSALNKEKTNFKTRHHFLTVENNKANISTANLEENILSFHSQGLFIYLMFFLALFVLDQRNL